MGSARWRSLAGGGVAGGKVIADWPGLYQARSTDATFSPPSIFAPVFKGALRDHLGVPSALL